MADRIKGLTGSDRSSILLALREDTIISGNKNYPVRPVDLQTPSSGTDVQWWHDLSQYGASFDAESDVLTYNGDGIRFEKSNEEYMSLTPGLSRQDGFKVMHLKRTVRNLSSFSVGPPTTESKLINMVRQPGISSLLI